MNCSRAVVLHRMHSSGKLFGSEAGTTTRKTDEGIRPQPHRALQEEIKALE